MEFRILGPIEVLDDERALALGPAQQRAVLAILLLHVNEVVSRDRLIEDVWGEHAPATAATALHGHVSRLRKVLEPDNGAERRVLITRAPGYLLELDPEQVDLQRFEALARRGKRQLARGETELAAATLAQALSLWRGPPLAEFVSVPFALAESRHLQELWFSTFEDRIEADLALGRHDDLLSELEPRVVEHPFRERLCGQLMLALYRCGRQAEALEVYRMTRRRLVDELGIEPGPALRTLEQAILRQDPAIAPPVTPAREAAASRSVPSRGLRRRVIFPSVVALAAVLSLGFVVGRHRKAPIRLAPASVGFIDAKSGRLTRSFPVGRDPSAVSVVDGSVWVANRREQTITRIDRASGHTDTFAVGGHPTSLAGLGSAVWVWTDEGLLVRVDSRYNTAGRPVRLSAAGGTAREPGRIAAGAGVLWITVPEKSLLRVDPAHVERRSTITLDMGSGGPLIDRGGQVWVAGSAFAGYVFPIESRTGTPGSGIEVGGPVYDLALGGGSLWVASGGAVIEHPRPALRAVDVHDGLVRTTLAIGTDPVAVVSAGGSIWVADGSGGTVERVDPSQARVRSTIRLGAHPTALAADRDGVWVSVE